MRYYHRTASAEAILTEGFRDGEGTYATGEWQRGVFLSDFPLNGNEGAGTPQEWAAQGGDLPLLAVDINDELIADCEWVEEGSAYREWCVPADLLNHHASVRLMTEEEVEEAEWDWHCHRLRILRDLGLISENEFRTQTTRPD